MVAAVSREEMDMTQEQAWREVYDRLGKIERQDAELLVEVRNMTRQLAEHDGLIHGAGGELGLRTRVDRLEQQAATVSRVVWLVVGAAVVAAVGGVVSGVSILMKLANT